MSLEWNSYTIGESCNLITGFPFKSKYYLENGAYNVVRGDNVKEGFIQWGDKKRCWDSLNDKLEKVILKDKDIVIGMDGSKLGKNRATISKKDLPALLAQRVACVRAKEGFDQDYIKYVILSNYFKAYVDKVKTGTSIPHISLGQISEFTFEAPDYKKQKIISAILSNLDKKIRVNQEINKNLINISKSIFRQKFLNYEGYEDFKDTDYGRIPSTFDVFTLNEISKEIVCGKTPSTKVEDNYGDKMPFITIPDMHNNVFIIETERKLSEKGIQSQKKKTLPKNSICVSCIATAGLVSLTYEESQTNQQINSIICKDNISPYFMYLYLNELSEYIKMLGSGGSTTLNLNKNEFSKIKVAIPNNGDMNKFNDLIEPIFNKIKFNQLEIIELTKLRDTLLPKLMNGEINVSKINCDLD